MLDNVTQSNIFDSICPANTDFFSIMNQLPQTTNVTEFIQGSEQNRKKRPSVLAGLLRKAAFGIGGTTAALGLGIGLPAWYVKSHFMPDPPEPVAEIQQEEKPDDYMSVKDKFLRDLTSRRMWDGTGIPADILSLALGIGAARKVGQRFKKKEAK